VMVPPAFTLSTAASANAAALTCRASVRRVLVRPGASGVSLRILEGGAPAVAFLSQVILAAFAGADDGATRAGGG
ncbi:MAG: hypothetical protein WAZ97_00720, partial [Pseudolabrys sp.]